MMNDLVAKAKEWREAAARNALFRLGLVVAVFVAVVDQGSKYWIVNVLGLPDRLVPCAKQADAMCAQVPLLPIFDLTFVRNYGMSFGLFAGGIASRIVLSAITFSIAAGLIVWLGRLERRIAAIGIGFIIGGAIGNLYDRVTYGYVVDFLDFSGLYFPWVFNVADAAINVGVALLLLDAWLDRDNQSNVETTAKT
ncbi:MAG: signal peptidase II [Pseudomonadota bacterium]